MLHLHIPVNEMTAGWCAMMCFLATKGPNCPIASQSLVNAVPIPRYNSSGTCACSMKRVARICQAESHPICQAGQVHLVSEQVICWQDEWSMPSGNHDESLLRQKPPSHMGLIVLNLQLCFATSGCNNFICNRQAHQLMAVTCLDSNV